MSRKRIMPLNQTVSNRIAMLRPMLIIGVVFVHLPGMADKSSELQFTMFNLFAGWLKNGLFRGSVPTMSLIAGYLLFSAGLDLAPLKLFRKKFTTLAVPFVLFNVLCLLFMAGVNDVMGMVYAGLQTLPGSTLGAAKMVFGFYGYPIDFPLHFVRDMMVTVLMVPLLSIAIRNFPWFGLAALALFFGTNQDGIVIMRASSLLLFYIGGAAAVYKWDVLALDRYAKPCLAAFLLICACMVVLRIDDNTGLVMVAPFLIWPAVSLLKGSNFEASTLRLSKYSFFIFVAHAPLLLLTWWYVSHHARWIPYPVYWLTAPLLVIAALTRAYDFAARVAPRALSVALGSRVGRLGMVERRGSPRPANAPVYSPSDRRAMLNT